MNWARLLTSPPPTTSWLLDSSVLAALRREPKGGVLWAAEPIPPGVFEVGPRATLAPAGAEFARQVAP